MFVTFNYLCLSFKDSLGILRIYLMSILWVFCYYTDWLTVSVMLSVLCIGRSRERPLCLPSLCRYGPKCPMFLLFLAPPGGSVPPPTENPGSASAVRVPVYTLYLVSTMCVVSKYDVSVLWVLLWILWVTWEYPVCTLWVVCMHFVSSMSTLISCVVCPPVVIFRNYVYSLILPVFPKTIHHLVIFKLAKLVKFNSCLKYPKIRKN